ncbi:hypothetical protein DFH27DRAFT_275320 [Peziza echinospora]|nr:hypothetical protein DFH27DRAFT_275320 [Peziza echinospora]
MGAKISVTEPPSSNKAVNQPWTPGPLDPTLAFSDEILHQLGYTQPSDRVKVRLRENLLWNPSDTTSRISNLCANATLDGCKHGGTTPRSSPTEEARQRLERSFAGGAGEFWSLSYMDQVALVCLSSGIRACFATDCTKYRERLESAVPPCESWPGLRAWLVCAASCALRAMGENLAMDGDQAHDIKDIQKETFSQRCISCIACNPDPEERNENAGVGLRAMALEPACLRRLFEGTKIIDAMECTPQHGSGTDLAADVGFLASALGMLACKARLDSEVIRRFREHATALIALTAAPSAIYGAEWDITGSLWDAGGWIDANPDTEAEVGRENMIAFPPPKRVKATINSTTFEYTSFKYSYFSTVPLCTISVADVFQMALWLRNASAGDRGGEHVDAYLWYDSEFSRVLSGRAMASAHRIKDLGFCQQRVWEAMRYSPDQEAELPVFVSGLEKLGHLKHDGHRLCNPGFCEFATINFTSVAQLHRCPQAERESCRTTPDGMFSQATLVDALRRNPMAVTAWRLDGMALVSDGETYLAISHVWSDGTGAGAWRPGQVNGCLWAFFVGMAERLGCDGVWWDTVCIPQEKTARSAALNNMHNNYARAKYTVVHDLYIAGVEWKDDGSPCIALVLSPWFTRGWTALELLLSEQVIVVFKDGAGHTFRNLDDEVLAQHRFLDSIAHWVATRAVKRLRPPSRILSSGSDLLSILRARHTSWARDQSIIAGLMCGLSDHVTLPEQTITQKILTKLGNIGRNSLLHTLPTMSEPASFAWCPARFIDLPPGGDADPLRILGDGSLLGRWEILHTGSRYLDGNTLQPTSMDAYVRMFVSQTLDGDRMYLGGIQCAILVCGSYNGQGLLVIPVRNHVGSGEVEDGALRCKYVGSVSFKHTDTSAHVDDSDRVYKDVHIIGGWDPSQAIGLEETQDEGLEGMDPRQPLTFNEWIGKVVTPPANMMTDQAADKARYEDTTWATDLMSLTGMSF